jgi:hypothetical protein
MTMSAKMTTMSGEIRVYLPLQTEHLIALQDGDELETGLVGFAVSEELRRRGVDAAAEEEEFLALQHAAAAVRAAGRPVVIGAADVPGSAVSEVRHAGEGSAVEVGVALETADFCAFHLDDIALGRPVDLSSVEPDEAIDLSWYDVSEMAQVLRHLTT